MRRRMINVLQQANYNLPFRGRILDNTSNRNLIIASVAFNNPIVIALQIQLIKKYLQDDFVYFVADNSTHPDAREKMRHLCKKCDIP